MLTVEFGLDTGHLLCRAGWLSHFVTTQRVSNKKECWSELASEIIVSGTHDLIRPSPHDWSSCVLSFHICHMLHQANKAAACYA